jgi:hypothetical protein
MVALVSVLMLPFFIVNTLGGIVAAVWLAVLGQWGAIGAGLGVMLIAHFGIAFAMLPQIALGTPSVLLYGKGHRLLGAVFALPPLIYLYGVITLWCGAVLWYSMMRVTTATMLIPMILWSYTVATAPWSYMASQENNLTSSVPVFVLEVGYIIMGLMILFGQPTFFDVMGVFVAVMAIAVVLTWAYVGVALRKQSTPSA